MPYLSFAPSAWVLPLKFSGGGNAGGAKIMFDSEGNAWSGDNFLVGWQGHDDLWDGNLSKFAPNGRPLSPMTSGFTGGGLLGPGFGTAIDANDRVWATSTSGQTISLFDKSGNPLSPPEGYNFGGKIGTMQGIIVTPNGDVWALDFGDDKVVYMPKGDPRKVKFYCQSTDGKPNKDSPCKLNAPFHLAIDQQDRIWITNALGDTVTRFPASDPSKVEVFPTGGSSGKGMAIDSKGNAWITNTAGSGLTLETKLRLLALKLSDRPLMALDHVAIQDLMDHPGLGSVSMLRPDGSPAPGSPFNPGQHLGRLGRLDRWQRPCLDFQLRPRRRLNGTLRCTDRDLPGWHEDWRSDFTSRRLQGRRHAVVSRCLHRSRWGCLGIQQLARSRVLLRQAR